MSGLPTRFLLTIGTLAALSGVSRPCRAERPPAWRGTSLLQLTASREALAPSAARSWGLSYLLDEAYAGPWAQSPLSASARGAAPTRDAVTPPERAPAAAAPGANRSPADNARSAESLLGRLGPLGMLASVVVPAAMASSGAQGGLFGKGVTTRVGFAKMGGGYGVLVAGRF